MNFLQKIAVVALLLSVFCVNIYPQNQQSDAKLRAKLVGIWQDSSSVGAGLSNNFQFFSNKSYRFNYNEMNGTKRLLSHSGVWKVKDGKLVLRMKKIEILIGGKLVEDENTGDYIEGGKRSEIKVSPSRKITLSLSVFTKEDIHQTVKIDGIKFWKLSENPKAYENQ